MTWEEQFPHPGLAPTKPAATTLFGDPATHKYNDWVRAMRKHNVAKAVDALMIVEATGTLNAGDTIALTLGVMLLDGSVADRADNIFGLLF